MKCAREGCTNRVVTDGGDIVNGKELCPYHYAMAMMYNEE
jgi:hypothetical protein